MRIGRALAALGAALWISTAAAPAAAQREPPESAAAKAQFKNAQRLFTKGDHAAALLEFKKISDETASPNARLYVARCLRELGRLPEAYDELNATVTLATTRAESDKKYVATRDSAVAERTALEAKIVRVVIAVPKKLSGLEIEVDGKRFADERIGTTMVIAPGTIRVTARAPGYVAFDETLAVDAGANETVTVTLAAAAKKQPPPSKAEPDPFKDDHPAKPPKTVEEGGGVRTLGVIVLGVGVAGGVTFAVAGLMANSRYDEIHAECATETCNQKSHGERINGGKTLDLAANVGLVAGGVGILAGTLMILFGGPTEKPAATGLGIEASPKAAALRYHGRF
jgi:hypothetical protein